MSEDELSNLCVKPYLACKIFAHPISGSDKLPTKWYWHRAASRCSSRRLFIDCLQEGSSGICLANHPLGQAVTSLIEGTFMIQKRIQLAGNYQSWLPTGIFLRAGQIARISATGTISFGPFGSWFFSPSGQDDRPAGANAPAPGMTANSLVARAGGEVQYIGASGSITADTDAQLELAANDDWSADNGGYWNITIRLG